MEELLSISGFIIRLIEGMGIDRNVGGGPDGLIVEDDKGIRVVENKKMEELIERISSKDAFSIVSESFNNIVRNEVTKKSGKGK